MKTVKKPLGRWSYALMGVVVILLVLRAVFPDFFAGLGDGLTDGLH